MHTGDTRDLKNEFSLMQESASCFPCSGKVWREDDKRETMAMTSVRTTTPPSPLIQTEDAKTKKWI
jgi:hypothetical protein